MLSREGEGRVALLLSDHIWLWARGFEGGGPHLDLLRRLSHWLMKQPDLEEEALRFWCAGAISSSSARPWPTPSSAVTVTTPSGATRTLTLDAARARHLARDASTANELGLWRATDGKLTTLVNVGPANPREFAEVTSTTEVLRRSQRDRRRRAAPDDSGSAMRVPRVIRGALERTFKGDDWIGLKLRDASVVRGIGVLPVFAGLLGLLLLIGALAATWAREGR